MNRFEKRKLKRKIYKHINAILYTSIFLMVSVITMIAAFNRNDDVSYVDEKQLSAAATEAIGIENDESVKVAASDQSQTEVVTETVEMQTENTTHKEESVTDKTENTTHRKVKVVADTLLVRSEKSQDCASLGSLDEDDIVEVVAEYGEWIEIDYNGKTGYISAEFVEQVE